MHIFKMIDFRNFRFIIRNRRVLKAKTEYRIYYFNDYLLRKLQIGIKKFSIALEWYVRRSTPKVNKNE